MLIQTYITELWNYMVLSAPYFILGLIGSALIHYFIKNETIKKYLGGSSYTNVFKAAAIGVPLPLCSCSVIPAAITLKKNGASTAATSSFLISTPESGVDSIAMTYALIGLPMAILRPLAAFSTAFVAGIGQILFKTENDVGEVVEEKKPCCSKSKKNTDDTKSLGKSFRYAFIDLIDDMAGWLTFGLLLGAMINMAVPEDFFHKLGAGTSMLAMLAIGVPFYICASASTPIAASLILKGMSPGSALVFLLVGPATNLSNIMIIQKYLGKRAVLINILAIVVVSVVFGLGVDMLMPSMDVELLAHKHEHHSIFKTILAVIFSGILISTLFKKYVWKKLKK